MKEESSSVTSTECMKRQKAWTASFARLFNSAMIVYVHNFSLMFQTIFKHIHIVHFGRRRQKQEPLCPLTQQLIEPDQTDFNSN